MGILEILYIVLIICVVLFYLYHFIKAVSTGDHTKLRKLMKDTPKIAWSLLILLIIVLALSGTIFQDIGTPSWID